MFTNGPPLLPAFIAASVWIKFIVTPDSTATLLLVALIIPLVTVLDSSVDNGVPIAITSSPGCNASESPSSTVAGISTLSSVILIIATSWFSS